MCVWIHNNVSLQGEKWQIIIIFTHTCKHMHMYTQIITTHSGTRKCWLWCTVSCVYILVVKVQIPIIFVNHVICTGCVGFSSSVLSLIIPLSVHEHTIVFLLILIYQLNFGKRLAFMWALALINTRIKEHYSAYWIFFVHKIDCAVISLPSVNIILSYFLYYFHELRHTHTHTHTPVSYTHLTLPTKLSV